MAALTSSGDSDGGPRNRRVRGKRDPNLDRFDGLGYQKRRARDHNANLYDSGESTEVEGICRDPERFKSNLLYIIEAYGLELRLLSETAEVEYRWLRRIVKDGLSRRVGRLDRLARHLGLPDGDYLWAANIKRFLPPPPKPERLSTLKQKLAWPYAERLLELLETGGHEYLKDLIDRLHTLHLSHPAGGSNDGPASADPLVAGERIQAVQDFRPADPSASPHAEPESGMSQAATLADRIRSRKKAAQAS